MTDDLPARMRTCISQTSAYKLLDEAADEIEKLRAALREIAALPATGRVHVIATAALGDRHD